ncbi:MAG: glycosyltransferase family 2 protein [Lentisphaeria bacterium]|nr:glycosyltransferase family 2 protein [Lentisphaeria bacterium]
MNIKVTVCIPVYGVENYIERCARSLFEQTMRDGIEFIFVNDCTKDRSIEILEQVLAEYPHRKEQTRIIYHEKNRGLVAARNTGLAYASGEYIIHCDSDDWVDSNLYETMYLTAVNNNADIVYAPYIAHEGVNCVQNPLPECVAAEDLLQNILDDRLQWGLWSKMVRREIAKDPALNCPDAVCYSEDLLRICQMLNKSSRVAAVKDVYYHYFKGNTNAYTKNFSRKSLDSLAESIKLLKTNLSDRYNFDTVQTFMLFMGTIYCLYSAKEFRCLTEGIAARQIIHNRNSFPIRLVVFGATVSYTIISYICNFLLKIRNTLKVLCYRERK